MDKRKAIAAYRLGLITVQECAQVLGLDNAELLAGFGDARIPQRTNAKKQSVRL